MADAVATAEKNAAKKSARSARAARLAALDQEILRQRTERALGGASITRQLGEAEDVYNERASDTRRDATLHRAFSTRGSAGRGIALSGVRFGNDSRISRDLIRNIGKQTGEFNRQQAGLREQKEALRTRARQAIRAAQAEQRGIRNG